MENNVKPIKSAEEVEQEIRSNYQKKLILKDYVIPVPNFLNDGWMSETGYFYSHKYFQNIIWQVWEWGKVILIQRS